MKVLVRDRRAGKTTELIRWLLEGKQQEGYPHWSRVIVSTTHKMALYTTEMVVDHIVSTGWDPCEHMLPHAHLSDQPHLGVLTDVRKAVWSLEDLDHNLRRARDFEYALDDADHIYHGGGFVRASFRRPPAVIVLTGEHVDSLCD